MTKDTGPKTKVSADFNGSLSQLWNYIFLSNYLKAEETLQFCNNFKISIMKTQVST